MSKSSDNVQIVKLLADFRTAATLNSEAALELTHKLLDRAEIINNKPLEERTAEEKAVYDFIFELFPSVKKLINTTKEYNKSVASEYVEALKLFSNTLKDNNNA